MTSRSVEREGNVGNLADEDLRSGGLISNVF